ncbi:HNH endonuclease [Couchioplanes caeruleus]|uniref:HNH domain-containing protein n=2 Tax=Couchioplanes caeruleus TaxID=56438 RepID=A0A1K0FNY5_9ACTN|nr:HNH endonuclease [Couchioplanes caeruleus]OJF14551.1 hypothetical protein BG844_09480 [Couchioplanes caeruleus subsp. caeruleus]ROP21288.1 HNH endonuclease [Couchioplanes caeruleus]
MTGPLPAGMIGYRGDDDVVLRLALFELWKSRCHMCDQPQLFGNTHIDHIIPQKTTDQELRDLITQHGLPTDFHLHRPSNLALICSNDNKRKGARLLPLHSRAMTDLLDFASRHAAEVERLVRAHASANGVARNLIRSPPRTYMNRRPATRSCGTVRRSCSTRVQSGCSRNLGIPASCPARYLLMA